MPPERSQAQTVKYPGHYMCWAHDELTEMFKSSVPTLCQKCFKAVASRQVQLVGVLIHRVITLHRRIMGLEKSLDKYAESMDRLEHLLVKTRKELHYHVKEKLSE